MKILALAPDPRAAYALADVLADFSRHTLRVIAYGQATAAALPAGLDVLVYPVREGTRLPAPFLEAMVRHEWPEVLLAPAGAVRNACVPTLVVDLDPELPVSELTATEDEGQQGWLEAITPDANRRRALMQAGVFAVELLPGLFSAPGRISADVAQQLLSHLVDMAGLASRSPAERARAHAHTDVAMDAMRTPASRTTHAAAAPAPAPPSLAVAPPPPPAHAPPAASIRITPPGAPAPLTPSTSAHAGTSAPTPSPSAPAAPIRIVPLGTPASLTPSRGGASAPRTPSQSAPPAPPRIVPLGMPAVAPPPAPSRGAPHGPLTHDELEIVSPPELALYEGGPLDIDMLTSRAQHAPDSLIEPPLPVAADSPARYKGRCARGRVLILAANAGLDILTPEELTLSTVVAVPEVLAWLYGRMGIAQYVCATAPPRTLEVANALQSARSVFVHAEHLDAGAFAPAARAHVAIRDLSRAGGPVLGWSDEMDVGFFPGPGDVALAVQWAAWLGAAEVLIAGLDPSEAKPYWPAFHKGAKELLESRGVRFALAGRPGTTETLTDRPPVHRPIKDAHSR